MASFVTEVLAHSGRLEKEDLGTRISRLTRRVEEIKGEVCSMISKKYSEFLPSMQSAQNLVTQVDELSGDIDLLKSRIENEISTAIEEYNCALTEKKYVTAAHCLEEKLIVWKFPPSKDTSGLEFCLQTELHLCTEQSQKEEKTPVPPIGSVFLAFSILGELHTKLKSFGQMLLRYILRPLASYPSLYAVTESQPSAVIVRFESVTIDLEHPSPSEVFAKIRLVLEVLQKQLLGQMLLKYILRPLASYPSLYAVTESQPSAVIVRFESVTIDLEHPSPSEVFAKIRLVLEVLQKQLLDLPLDNDLENEKAPTIILAEMLGDVIWEDLSECLIKNCLVYSIPTNSSKLQQYEEVIQSTEEFENALKEMRFLKGDTTDLLKYARNINSHFANKKCQDVIVAARNLMTSEIHNTVKITPDSKISVPDLPSLGEDDKLEVQKVSPTQINKAVTLEPASTLDQHSFSLPTCLISESVKKLMELAYQTLLETTTSSDQCAIQLFYSVRNIFHLFHDVVPTYHKENLQKLPQLAAIHHNNCMYIAHHLLTLGHQFRLRLAPILCDGTATFVDLVPGFRRLGTECFLAQMRAQKGELLERLSSARNFSNMDDEENYSAANKAIRQVLHQLKRLGIVWQDVLPVNIYCKAMGTLLNTAVSEIIGRITALEDISTEDADRLYSLCKTVVDEGPQVFAPLSEESKNKKYQEEVPVYVPKWMPFKELMMILQASLQEIGDRWADGKGPLAAAFSSSEVKALIRALFQNTERRAAAIAKIK
ncbi:Centromere/kinetochore protein zw10 like protein [Tupaia chinensis]|uniref:Centromere/kinetochore protein zw10 homolog n=1 Tax=Tupaia chinensis TaxID=246437 RepID=L9KNA0_TUPCH|nr:Centromere/kinetochore protein zw10 like protein [Tupaia chinensis]